MPGTPRKPVSELSVAGDALVGDIPTKVSMEGVLEMVRILSS